jgi:hypothetical protein
MGRIIVAVVFGLLFAGGANASDCSSWMRLADDAKYAKIDRMIEGHLNSNVGKRYTSENTVAMRRCLNGYVEELRAEFDGACGSGGQSPLGVIDEIFDRYFLSCVQ